LDRRCERNCGERAEDTQKRAEERDGDDDEETREVDGDTLDRVEQPCDASGGNLGSLTETALTTPFGAMPEPTGLTEDEARRRLAERGPIEPPASSRSYASIVRANVLTVFNLILVISGVITIAFGDWRDSLFLYILLANTAIGITQEVKAKHALDRLAALVAPVATVVRDREARAVAVEELVVGDLVRAGPGDQIVADGELVAAERLAVDESILTGESEPVQRTVGDEVRSGSFVAEGRAGFSVSAVGPASYAEQIAGEARIFRHPRSPLERAVSTLLFGLVAVMVLLGALLSAALAERDVGFEEAVETAVAAVLTLVPEGLILLVSLTYAVSALRMARRGALAQQLNAIESLASADVVCLDKTGTLTEPGLRVCELVPAPKWSADGLSEALGRYAASAPARNATLEAIAEAYSGSPEPVEAEIPFSSQRRWSALRLGSTSYVLGAPELYPLGRLAGRVEEEGRAGRRVLAFGTTTADLNEDERPPDPTLLGLVVLAEELRPQARETVAYFQAEGVELKVISGDAPETVAAIASDAGIPLAGPPADGRELPDDPAELRQFALGATVVGRISPEGKRRLVEALRHAGKYVAMVGDGVNDVPALKAARLGIAQGSGSQMAKTVADVVLVKSDFGSVPAMVAEGRKLLRNLQRVTKLFVTKSAFAAFLIVTIGLTPQSYPFLPRHLSLAAAIAVGVPAFFLALAPSAGPWRPTEFLKDVARFAVPAGTAAGLGVLSSYLFAHNVIDLPLVEARTVATTVLVVVGLYLVLALEAPRVEVTALCLALFALYLVVLVLPMREFFELAPPNAAILLSAAGGVGLAIGGLWLTGERFVPGWARSSGHEGEAKGW
jgi:cation-transporting P-type ATPase E